jgi:hypothetical protein
MFRLQFQLVLFSLLSLGPATAQVIDATTLNGKFIFGYQGWFTSQLDSDPYSSPYNTSIHWAQWGEGLPAPDNMTVDMWPDASAYAGLVPLYSTAFKTMANGQPAQLYSAWDSTTVDLHFNWMRQYGLDGVALQEFVQGYSTEPASLQSVTDKVATNVMASAVKYGRVFYVTLDCSGCTSSTVIPAVETRWEHLVDDLHLTTSTAYLHHEGLPIVSVFGFGFNFGLASPPTPPEVASLIAWFREGPIKYRATLIGQTCTGWRTNGQGCLANSDWTAVYRSYNVISPWLVGGWTNIAGADSNWSTFIKGDMTQTKANGQGYMPVIWPGFSDSNLQRSDKHPATALNKIPRLGGLFWWHQVYNYRGRDAAYKINMALGAMFDEVDEGTAMFKLAPLASGVPQQAPAGFVYLDIPDSNSPNGYNLPNDWYLKLANCGTQVIHGAFVPTGNIPISPPGAVPGC